MKENVDHFLLFQSGLEHLFGVAEHSEAVVALADLELPVPVLVLGLLQRLKIDIEWNVSCYREL